MKFTKFIIEPALVLLWDDGDQGTYDLHPHQDLQVLAGATVHCPDLEVVEIGGEFLLVDANDPRHSDNCDEEYASSVSYVSTTYALYGHTEERVIQLQECDNKAYLEEIKAALEAPVRVVLDTSGGAWHATYADRPVEVLMISHDDDDVAEARGEGILKEWDGQDVASWGPQVPDMRDVNVVEHYFSQMTQKESN